MKSWEIGRRACVRGLGSAIGLPALEAMLPGIKRARAAGASPKRIVFFVFTGGIPDTEYSGSPEQDDEWGSFWPKTLGANYETTRILQSLEKYGIKQDVSIIRNLHNLIGSLGGMGGHPEAANAILTAAEPELTYTPTSTKNISVDQLAASYLKQYTPALPSLYLANPFHPAALSDTMSWSSATTKVPVTMQPLAAFNKIFGDKTLDAAALKKRIAYKLSVFHQAKGDIDNLRSSLGKADRQSLEKYFDSISALETQIAASGKLDACGAPAVKPEDSTVIKDPTAADLDVSAWNVLREYNVDLPSHFHKMADMITLAFQCDRTRVIVVHLLTHQLRFSWLGAPYDQYPSWHDDVQHLTACKGACGKGSPVVQTYIRGAASQIEPFAYLVKKLKDTPEGDGTGSLLDSSTLVCTSELSFGNGHNMRCVPVILAGGAGGLVKRGQGRSIAVPGEQPIANLYVPMLNAVGVKDVQGREITSFGNSTAPLSLG